MSADEEGARHQLESTFHAMSSSTSAAAGGPWGRLTTLDACPL